MRFQKRFMPLLLALVLALGTPPVQAAALTRGAARGKIEALVRSTASSTRPDAAAVAAEERRAEEQQLADSLARAALEEAPAEPAAERPAQKDNDGFFD